MDELVQQKADIFHHHLFGFFSYLKWVRVPTPVTVKEDTVIEFEFKLLTHRSLSDTHWAANKIHSFHFSTPADKWLVFQLQHKETPPSGAPPLLHRATAAPM